VKPVLLVALLLSAGCMKQVMMQEFSLVLEAAEDWEPRVCERHEARIDLVEVMLPEYLMSRGFVVQRGSSAVVVAKHHFWAEPLDTAVHKVLVQDISAQLPTFDITAGSGQLADCTLLIDFDRLHASNDSRMLVSGRYALTGSNTAEHREFDVSLPLSVDSEAAMVTVMRRALGELSAEIALVLQACAPSEEHTHDDDEPH
jgi:uncharacterized lipoprotein YmbA